MSRFRRHRVVAASKVVGAFFEPLEDRQLLSVSASATDVVNLGNVSAMTARPLGSTAINLAQEGSSFPTGNSTPPGFSPSQIKQAYGINAIQFGSVAGDGSGQTIAIINAFDNPKFVSSTDPAFSGSDLHKFDLQFSLPDPPSFEKVDQNGSTTSFPSTDPVWANEAALDVEWVHAIAPKAKLMLVEAYSDGLNDLIQSAVAFARQQPGVSVVTMSFAATEASGETAYDPFFTTVSGHQGVTFVAASGDNGSPGGYPAFSPNVVSVGGTSLTLSGSSYSSETGRAKSGGGVSQFEPKPLYQLGLDQSSSQRLSPDVSFDADPNTGVSVYDSFNGGTKPWYKIGGTSFSAPVWGALIAIADQGRAVKGVTTLDGATQTLPKLYMLNGTDFHDITSGNNGFGAGPGFDLVTGRGTPIANKLVPDLAGGGALISGFNFYDTNGSGTWDSGEPAAPNWGVVLDLNNDGIYQSNEPTVNSGPQGRYVFGDLPAATYHLLQFTPPGWRRTTPALGSWTITVSYGQSVTNKNYGNTQKILIPGNVFSDINSNGSQNSGEGGLSGWRIYMDLNNDGIWESNENSKLTDSSGNFSFVSLDAGTYHVRVVPIGGYSMTLPSAGEYVVSLGAGETTGKKQFGEHKA